QRFHRDDRPERFVMDGYPRTLAQACSFDQVLRQEFLDLSAVLHLAVDDEEIVRRVTGRWNCPGCKSTDNHVNRPHRTIGICDVCQSKLIQRPDDREDTVRERLRLYHANTDGLIAHYRKQGLLHGIPGVGDIEQIYEKIVQVLHQAKPSCCDSSSAPP